jgi:tryptophan 2,3-dioxygenase
MDQEKYASIHYATYLELEQLLSAQQPRSELIEGKAAHEEMLFIIVHQVYELWFKQILHELESIMLLFSEKRVDERNLGVAVARLERVIEIQKLLVQQIRIMETMTPLDFLDFRNYLFPASGFQSFQFRKMEAMLGLPEKGRMTYNKSHYASVFAKEQQQELADIEQKGSMVTLIEQWLERTPFLEFPGFNFLEKYKRSVQKMIDREMSAINASTYLSEEEKTMRVKMLGDTDTYFRSVLDESYHQEQVEAGNLRLSYKATIAALLIYLYREQPILHMPYRLLSTLLDTDEQLTAWRYRHAQMVLRMLGKKVGTGGSSGHDYLLQTAFKHHIFYDLHNLSTLLIPRSELPQLPDELIRELGFYYTVKNNQQ